MNDWQTILTTPHETIPSDEWWYALPPNLPDPDYTRHIRNAERVFKDRFGYPPDAIPRVVYVGNTPMLAYPCPEQPYIMATPEPEPAPPTRADTEGRDVTDLPGLWDDTDIELEPEPLQLAFEV